MKSNPCDYKNAYILVTVDITIVGCAAAQVAFNSCEPFIKCILKPDRTTIDDNENLDLVMLLHNLLENSSNYSNTTGSFWN